MLSLALAAAFTAGTGFAFDPPPAPQEIVAMVDRGDFKSANAAIDFALAQPGIPEDTARALAFERERMRRIRLDFPHDEAKVRADIKKQIPDLRDDEFARWEADNTLEHMTIDGQKRYFQRSVGNLWRLSPEALARRTEPPKFTDSPLESAHPHHKAAHDAALATGKAGVLPQRFRITQTLTVNADAVPAGETIDAWIPFPRAIPGQQDDIKLVDNVPGKGDLAPESALMRTMHLQGQAVAGKPTKFDVTYEVTISAQSHPIDPAKVVALSDKEKQDLAPYLSQELPHVQFTDAMRQLSRQTVGDEKNPYAITRKLFALVDDKFPWAGAREYSTIPNIGDYALHAHHGDCGQQTLLLITLLRMNGIPARWQSGMMFSPTDYWNLHDWGQVYIAPYGWVPMDVTFGRLEGDPATEWFYLGGLDGYRIAFNDAWGVDFVPRKTHFRSDTVDSQRGEVEWKGGNLYFDQFDYDFEWNLVPTTPPEGA
ncbi:Transglutaminase [Lysobacter dokdonensis DS-58]|uniref:Transglutaminase n=2 Tax=Noviluteimonas TaxID=3382693 RepID=A0A0A2X5M7_9GAMM|nr:Transglutaminase [Lysobacter dokdonensis DS-58]